MKTFQEAGSMTSLQKYRWRISESTGLCLPTYLRPAYLFSSKRRYGHRAIHPGAGAARKPNSFATGENAVKPLDLRGLVPAPVTPFTRDGAVDHAAIKRLGAWLGTFKDVKGLTVLGHAGEGTFMTQDEQAAAIESFVHSTNGRVPVIAGITL